MDRLRLWGCNEMKSNRWTEKNISRVQPLLFPISLESARRQWIMSNDVMTLNNHPSYLLSYSITVNIRTSRIYRNLPSWGWIITVFRVNPFVREHHPAIFISSSLFTIQSDIALSTIYSTVNCRPRKLYFDVRSWGQCSPTLRGELMVPDFWRGIAQLEPKRRMKKLLRYIDRRSCLLSRELPD